MLQPTAITWILIVFGAVTLFPLLGAQVMMVMRPHSQRTRDLLIAKGEAWRDQTHFRSAYGMACTDWILVAPLLVGGSLGVIWGQPWGYVLWTAAGTISLYINVVLWFMEKEYVYPSRGPLAYYTYYWGFFVYWGASAVAYAALRLSGVTF